MGVSLPYPCCRVEDHPLLAFQKCLFKIVSHGPQYLHLIWSLMAGCLDLTIKKKKSVPVISSNMCVIEVDVHWVPIAHDMDQDLTKWANISFSSGSAPYWSFTYIWKQMRTGLAIS